MHTDDGRVHHLHSGVMSAGQVLSSHAGNLATAHPAMFNTTRPDYAIREVVTERRALQTVDSLLGSITPQQVGHSTQYIEFWQQRVKALGGSRIP